jgi:hypothetical protein
MEWPTHFPDCCPPSDAEARKIIVYRFLDDKESSPTDFLTVRQKRLDRCFLEKEVECRACALSVLANREEVVRLQRRVPRWRKPVAEGLLTDGHGLIKHTPSFNVGKSHHSWWIPKGVEPAEIFYTIIEPPSSEDPSNGDKEA